VKHWFAKVRGWSPEVVESLSLEDMFWLPIHEEAASEAGEILRKQEEARQPK
jgi:hypothetical protein